MSNLFFYAFFAANFKALYIIAGLTTFSYTVPLSLALNFLSEKPRHAPPVSPSGLYSAGYLLSRSPSSTIVDHRNLKVFTLFNFCPCRFMSESSLLLDLKYFVFCLLIFSPICPSLFASAETRWRSNHELTLLCKYTGTLCCTRAVDNVTTLFRVWPLRFQFCQRY